MTPPAAAVPRSVDEIDWETWEPVDRATLLFVVDGDRTLLIHKKRGLGAGKVNAPGGRIERGEETAAAAVREVEEEVGVTPLDPVRCGDLSFQFVDGYSIHATVYRADRHRGTARETAEAIPLWTPLAAIPFDEMWADDRLWVPHVLAGRPFSGRFVFDGDAMLDHAIEVGDSGPPTANSHVESQAGQEQLVSLDTPGPAHLDYRSGLGDPSGSLE